MSAGQELPEIVVSPPGPRSRELSARLAGVECPAFDARREARARASGAEQAPIVYARGVGANLFDVDGNRYVDLVAGFGALPFGHASPVVLRAVEAEMRALPLALGDVYASEPKVRLCEELVRLFGPALGDARAKVMLGLSGADAVTAALKTAALATGKPGVVAFEGGYHGLSHGPLAACGFSAGFRAPFEGQLNAHARFACYPADEGDLDASLAGVVAALGAGDVGAVLVEPILGRGGVVLDASLAGVVAALGAGDVGAVLVEPILGRGGVVVPPPSFFPELRRLCDDVGALLVADEIWTGLFRAGGWLASSAPPDLLCLGKALGGGLPVSACVGRAAAMAPWGAHGGTAIHTATHFGSPPACAAALAVLQHLEESGPFAVDAGWRPRLAERVRGRGVREVRGAGSMVGVHLEGGAARALAVARALLRRGWIVLTGGVAGDVLTLTPPLDIDPALLLAFDDALVAALAE
jgi:4-aminobutyrate aminotransferase/(S)-3-amino-2-methylpropionate transaminase